MSMRTSRISMASVLTAVLVGGLLAAGPASAAPPVGSVSFKGKVTCKTAFPTPNTSVPTRVSLDSGEDDASGRTNNPTDRRATYGPLTLDVPLDSPFSLTVEVTCKAPGKKAQTFERAVPYDNLTEGDEVSLNIK
ncbi:hypothetical protein ACFY8W_19575 [Streptomyces sp. NPDC012637]|uniref:hypothetical protein n=1 Tax=Streptomyces sp. NPDC012637 TaxID=3364842 RepID=UPI0036EB9E29